MRIRRSRSPVGDRSRGATRPRIVIVGGGFGGLEAAKTLGRLDADVTLVDRGNHHCFQPLLYQVATAALSPADVAWPIRHILRRQRNTTVYMAEVDGVDLSAKRLRTDAVELPYDYLVIATGATHSYYGHDEWEAFAPALKTIDDATRIRRRMLIAFECAELAASETERERLLTFVIVGGGPTGVEMAGAIAEVARQTLRHDFRHIDPRSARIVLVEAGARILPALPPRLSDYATRALAGMGVEVITDTAVTRCDRSGVDLPHGRIDAGTVVWAAGVVASPAAQWLDARHDRNGRVVVEPDLSLRDRPEVFVIGDTAAVALQSGGMAPGVAPAAKQMGRYVGSVIRARIEGLPPPAPFAYRDEGQLATIGRRSAVVSLGRFRLTGALGWIFWSAAHIYFLIGLRNRFVVAFEWFWQYLTFQRGARLITDVDPPPYRRSGPPGAHRRADEPAPPPSQTTRSDA